MTQDGVCAPVNGRGFLLRPIECTGLDSGVSFQVPSRYLRTLSLELKDQGPVGHRCGCRRLQVMREALVSPGPQAQICIFTPD